MPRVADSERDARELLARWSAFSVLEPLQNGPSAELITTPTGPTPASTVRMASAPTAPSTRPDRHQPSGDTTIPSSQLDEERIPRRRKRRRRESVARDVVSLPTPPASAERKFSWSQLAGHLAAYGGVGLLSVGMTLVVWSYFGGPAAYAPTGWLLTTVGQMLLYLGVVTLVASGLEQTTDAVTLQLQQMGQKLERLEAASALRQVHRVRDAA